MREGFRRAMPRGLLGMLVSVLAVESAIARRDVHVSGMGPVCWRASRRAAETERDSRILCFGTSLSKFGLLPRVLEERTGRKAYNLAVFNGPMPASYFLLRRALRSGARPAAVVIDDQDAPALAREAGERPASLDHNWRSWPELLDLRDALDLAWSARDAGFLARTLLAKKLPSYRSRFEIRSCLRAALDGRDASTWFQVVKYQRNVAVNRGAVVAPRSQGDPPEVDPEPAPARPVATPGRRDRWVRHELNDRYLRRFLDLASRHRIAVFWLLPPLPPAVLERQGREGLDAYLARNSREVLGASPRVVVIDGRGAGYPPEAFHDRVHVDRQGAITLSTDVGSILARSLADPTGGPRRVALPPYRELAARVALEDLGQSQETALRGAKRR